MYINQIKLAFHDTYTENARIKTKFEAVNDRDVIKKAYLDGNLFKIEGHLSLLEKDYNDFKLQYNKQPVEEILIQIAVKTTIALNIT